MNQSNEFHPNFADKEEALIQWIAKEAGCTRDEVINELTKEFLKKVDQATDETELTGFARKVKKALIDAGLRS